MTIEQKFNVVHIKNESGQVEMTWRCNSWLEALDLVQHLQIKYPGSNVIKTHERGA